MESHKRTLMKTATWRVVATGITACVAYFLTGQIRIAASIGLLDMVLKLGAYFAHERLWLRTSYGRPKSPEYQIQGRGVNHAYCGYARGR